MTEIRKDIPMWRFQLMTPDGTGYKLTLNKDMADIFGLTEMKRKIRITVQSKKIVLELEDE